MLTPIYVNPVNPQMLSDLAKRAHGEVIEHGLHTHKKSPQIKSEGF
jgi:hypothetical protein